MTLSLPQLWRSERVLQFIKFCCVGGSGVVVDMGVLYLLADPKTLALNVTLGKILAAEAAMTNNFIWNELWTFRSSLSACGGEGRGEVAMAQSLSAGAGQCESLAPSPPQRGATGTPRAGLLRRFLLFNAICGIGIGLAVLLLHLFHTWLGWNLYVSNILAIILVTCWNFGLNSRWNWDVTKMA
jgi:dolichol-phosphate mannosyltransferase